MADSVTPEFLSSLKALYPATEQPLDNPWYYVAAVAFASSNLPEAVPTVLKFALDDLRADKHASSYDDGRKIVRKIRDTIFQAKLFIGTAKGINALDALYEATPEHLKDTKSVRDTSSSIEKMTSVGKELWKKFYGDTAEETMTRIKTICPDLAFTTEIFDYGFIFGLGNITTPKDISFLILASLIPADVPRQAAWHLDGARRNGATKEQVVAVRTIIIKCATAAGVTWKHDIPDVK